MAEHKQREKKEFTPHERADLLKERIYASIALLAVLLSIDPHHTRTGRVAIEVGGTALALWAASLVSVRIAHRVFLPEESEEEQRSEALLHAPLLLTAVAPCLLIGLAALDAFHLRTALDLGIGTIMLSIISWTTLAARQMKVNWLLTGLAVAAELGLAAAVVALKLAVSH